MRVRPVLALALASLTGMTMVSMWVGGGNSGTAATVAADAPGALQAETGSQGGSDQGAPTPQGNLRAVPPNTVAQLKLGPADVGVVPEDAELPASARAPHWNTSLGAAGSVKVGASTFRTEGRWVLVVPAS
jgi:hypothetical protein